MAIVKHIKSRNANYSAAINYLLFEDDEKTGKKIVDESGRSILRKEFYMDGLSCDPMSFDKECELTNAHFHKNKKREDIKSHHYIISYDPADVTENGLTGPIAQAISLELAKQMKCEKKQIIAGYRDCHTFLREEFEAAGTLYIATEDGSVGTKGNVMDAIRENALEADVIYACGPTPMLRAIKKYAEENGIECYISLEERMACGIGACLACVCKSREKDAHSNVNNKRICKDGPVFLSTEVEI